MPWQTNREPNTQRHDEPAPDVERSHYFSSSWFCCVETITAPCAVVIAWAKFAQVLVTLPQQH